MYVDASATNKDICYTLFTLFFKSIHTINQLIKFQKLSKFSEANKLNEIMIIKGNMLVTVYFELKTKDA